MSGKKPILLITKSKSSLNDKKEQEKTKQKLDEEQLQIEIQKSIAAFEDNDDDNDTNNSVGKLSSHTGKGGHNTMTWVRGGVFQPGSSTSDSLVTTSTTSNPNPSPSFTLNDTHTNTSSASLYHQQVPSTTRTTTTPSLRSSVAPMSPLLSAVSNKPSSSGLPSPPSIPSSSTVGTTTVSSSSTVTTVPHSSPLSTAIPHKSVFQGDDDEEDEESKAALIAAAAMAHQQKKLKEMNNFMDELKHKQEKYNSHSKQYAYDDDNDKSSNPSEVRSRDPSYELSTNIHIGHLPSNVTEEDLLQLFQKYGKIISIKIMWPRTPEEKARGFNSGFVLFQNRNDAENALRTLQKYTINDQTNNPVMLKLGWAKAVKTSSTTTALKVGPHGTVSMTTTAELLNDTGKSSASSTETNTVIPPLTMNATVVLPPIPVSPTFGGSVSPNLGPGIPTAIPTNEGESTAGRSLLSSSSEPVPSLVTMPSDTVPRYIDIPEDPVVRKLIDTWAPYVARDGQPLETVLINRVNQFIQEYYHYQEEFEKEKSKDNMDTENDQSITATDGNGSVFSSSLSSSVASQRAKLLFPEPYTPDHFYWLIETDLPDSHYYRWRVYSLLQGDTLTRWRTEPFQYQQNGSWWLPPECTTTTTETQDEHEDMDIDEETKETNEDIIVNDDIGEYKQRKRPRQPKEKDEIDDASTAGIASLPISSLQHTKGPSLPTDLYEEFRHILANLTLERYSIGDAMVFMIQNAEYSQDTVKQILHDLTIVTDSHDINRMLTVLIARLYLINDVLHNAGMTTIHNSSSYRIIFQTCLPDVFEIYGYYYGLLGGRASRTAFRERIQRVFASWNDRSIYPPLYIQGLESTLVRSVECTLDNKSTTSLSSNVTLEERQRQCKFAGLSYKNCSITELEYRLRWLQTYTNKRYGEFVKTDETNTDSTVVVPSQTAVRTHHRSSRRTYASKVPVSTWTDLPEGENASSGSSDTEDTEAKNGKEDNNEESKITVVKESTDTGNDNVTHGKEANEAEEEEEEDIDGVPLTPEMVQAWTKYRINLVLNRFNVHQ